MCKEFRIVKEYFLFISLVSCILLFTSCSDNNSPDYCTESSYGKIQYEYFVELSKIPRCTHNEKAVSDSLATFGSSLGFETFQDSMFNLLIKKNGSEGRENEPPIILQAHIDMVCNKDEDVIHNFKIDPIIPVIENCDWITAQKETTLGADNGSGVSMIMAILALNSISHPPIEALFTTHEEIGMVGAEFFDISLLKGRRLINLDMTIEGTFVVSSKSSDGPEVVIPLEPMILAKMASFPEWLYKDNSPLRNKMTKVFKDFYGKEPILAGINNNIAGVECLVFANKISGIDMVSIGPNILELHTPHERMSLSSFNRVYGYLVEVLKEL
jgi:di/tripeptidase